MGRNATSFQPGNLGNPKGRPKGIKEKLPRGLYKRVYLETTMAVAEGKRLSVEARMRKAIEKVLTNPRTVLQAIELGAKLNKEIGSGVLPDEQATTVVVEVHVEKREA